MNTHLKITTAVLGAAFMLSSTPAFAATALTASCAGTPATNSITWTASTTGGVAPLTYLWGNGSTLASQTVTAGVGAHSTTLQVTDASSTTAVATCSATVTAPVTPTASSTVAIDAQIKSIREQIQALTKQLRDLLLQKWAIIHPVGALHGKKLEDHGKNKGKGGGHND